MLKKIKQKIKDNPEETAFYAILGTTVVGITALFIVAAKEEAEKQKEFEDWTNDEYTKGHVVVQLANGNYIGVPPQSLVS